jgi:RecA/RadA recombinase
MPQPLPRANLDAKVAISNYLKTQKILRNLDGEDPPLAISSKCPPLDHTTGIGGLPRGRVIEIYGQESTGKCVTGDTLIPVPGQGLLTLEEITHQADWSQSDKGQFEPEATVPHTLGIPNVAGDVDATHLYYPGTIETTTLHTEHGHTLQGAATHRVLVLTEQGLARWTTLVNTRPGDTLITLSHTQVEGTKIPHPGTHFDPERVRAHPKEYLSLLGALATAEIRLGALYLTTGSKRQRRAIKEWCQPLGITRPYKEDPEWNNFTGFIRLSPELTDIVEHATSPGTLRQVRTAPLWAQQAWAAGLSLTRGQWSGDYLEIELAHPEAARVFQSVCDNIGIRWTRYQTLNTFGDLRYKLSLRSRGDQQSAEKILWEGHQLPVAWKKQYSPEEDDNHPHVKRTITLAKEALHKANQPHDDLDPDDTSKENCKLTLERLLVHRKTKTDHRVAETLHYLADERVQTDRATGTEKSGPQPCYDLGVPIARHYPANTLISHNSTLAMHFAREEMIDRAEAVVVYFDYERGFAKEYARNMGLLEFTDRFHILDADSVEQADDTVNGLFQEKLIPSIVIIDSVAAATPQTLYGRDMEDSAPIAIKARKWSEMLEKWVKYGGDYGTTFILLNQTRTKIRTDMKSPRHRATPGVPGAEDEDTPGGRAVKFYSSLRLRLEIKKVYAVKVFNPMIGAEATIPVANVVQAFAMKNKLAAPYRSGEFYIEFGRGVDTVRTMFDAGLTRGQIKRGGSGGWLSLPLPDGREIKAQGDATFIDQLRADAAAQKSLITMLQWDKADELLKQVLGYAVFTPGEDNVHANAELAMAASAMAGITTSMVNQAPTLAHKAEILNLFTRRGNTYSWHAPSGEIRSRDLSTMNGKIKNGDRDALQAAVDQTYAILKEAELSEVPPTMQVDPTPEPVNNGNNGVVERPIIEDDATPE